MKFSSMMLIIILLSGCSSVIKNDFSDINPKDKSVVEIIKSLINKGYSCDNVEPTEYEADSFIKSGHEIIKYTCVKQTNSLFCVDNHFIYLYQDKNTKEALLLEGNTSPVCIWTR